MKAYGGVDVWIHVFLISALVGGGWSASRPGCFPPEERYETAVTQFDNYPGIFLEQLRKTTINVWIVGVLPRSEPAICRLQVHLLGTDVNPKYLTVLQRLELGPASWSVPVFGIRVFPVFL
jgi:hypothetical protein